MLDGINQTKDEAAYRKSHKGLIIELTEFDKYYKSLKAQIFEIIKNIKKEDKRNHLLDRT